MAKRFYSLRYTADQAPVYMEDMGNLLKISGILLQGKGSSFLVLSPTACYLVEEPGAMEILRPGLDLWCEIIRQTDDPVYFERDETGTIKAVHRKQRAAISGAVQQRIWVRDNLRCMFCGLPTGEVQLTVDHFVPLEKGGSLTEENLITACRRCNKSKGDMPPELYCEQKKLDYQGLAQYLTGTFPASFISHLN